MGTRGLIKIMLKPIICSVSYVVFLLYKIKIISFLLWIRTQIYDQLMCLIFKCKHCRFGYPINGFYGSIFFKIEEETRFGKEAVLTAWPSFNGMKFTPSVNIGRNCNFGDYLHLSCINRIVIGNDVLTGRWVTISDNGHGSSDKESLLLKPIERKLVSKKGVEIGDSVWIGDKVTILDGVTIGRGSIIGANTVVAKDIPPFSVAVGSPMRILCSVANCIDFQEKI